MVAIVFFWSGKRLVFVTSGRNLLINNVMSV